MASGGEEKEEKTQDTENDPRGSNANTENSGGAADRDIAENGGERDSISQHISAGITTDTNIFDGVHRLVQATAHMRPPSTVEEEEKKESSGSSEQSSSNSSSHQPRRSGRRKMMSMEAIEAAANAPPAPPDSQHQQAAAVVEQVSVAEEAYTRGAEVIIEKAKAAYEQIAQTEDEHSAMHQQTESRCLRGRMRINSRRRSMSISRSSTS